MTRQETRNAVSAPGPLVRYVAVLGLVEALVFLWLLLR
jgi:hypothetical protein